MCSGGDACFYSKLKTLSKRDEVQIIESHDFDIVNSVNKYPELYNAHVNNIPWYTSMPWYKILAIVKPY